MARDFRPPARPVRALALAVLSAAASVLVAAQQPDAQTFRTGIEAVRVDVSVLDKSRVPIGGLTAADFTVLEDGKPRPIVGFVPVTLPPAPRVTPGAAWLRDVAPDVATNDVPREGRLVVIMFDWSIRFEDQQLARRVAAAAVDQLASGDLAAVVFTSAFGNAGSPQNFTADRTRLRDAIDRPFALALRNPPVGPGHDPRNQNEVMLDDPEGYESGDCQCRVCVAETIAHVADAVRNVPERRKTLLFIGTYFRSYEALQGPISRPAPGPPAAVTAVVKPTPQQMNCSAYLKEAREKMLRAASLANLTIHVLDPAGLETTLNSPMGGSAVGIQERQADLRVPADLTGGRAIMDTEAPEAAVPALFAESRSYYLLAFTPADSRPNRKLHALEVKVNRAGATVHTRGGYYGGETRAVDRSALLVSRDTADALQGVLPRGNVPLAVAVSPFAGPAGADAAIAIVLGVRHPAASAAAAGTAPVKVIVAAFDRKGRAVQSETQTIAVSRKPDATGGIRYEVLSRLALKPGRYELRAAIEAGSSETGSVFTFVDVPDFARDPLSMSGLVLAAPTAPVAASRDGFANLLPVVPTAQRAFSPGDRVTAFARVNQAGARAAQPATVTATVRDANDRAVWTDTTTIPAAAFVDARGADYRIDLPFDRFAAGEHLLTIEAAQGSHVVRRSVRFSIG